MDIASVLYTNASDEVVAQVNTELAIPDPSDAEGLRIIAEASAASGKDTPEKISGVKRTI